MSTGYITIYYNYTSLTRSQSVHLGKKKLIIGKITLMIRRILLQLYMSATSFFFFFFNCCVRRLCVSVELLSTYNTHVQAWKGHVGHVFCLCAATLWLCWESTEFFGH